MVFSRKSNPYLECETIGTIYRTSSWSSDLIQLSCCFQDYWSQTLNSVSVFLGNCWCYAIFSAKTGNNLSINNAFMVSLQLDFLCWLPLSQWQLVVFHIFLFCLPINNFYFYNKTVKIITYNCIYSSLQYLTWSELENWLTILWIF